MKPRLRLYSSSRLSGYCVSVPIQTCKVARFFFWDVCGAGRDVAPVLAEPNYSAEHFLRHCFVASSWQQLLPLLAPLPSWACMYVGKVETFPTSQPVLLLPRHPQRRIFPAHFFSARKNQRSSMYVQQHLPYSMFLNPYVQHYCFIYIRRAATLCMSTVPSMKTSADTCSAMMILIVHDASLVHTPCAFACALVMMFPLAANGSRANGRRVGKAGAGQSEGHCRRRLRTGTLKHARPPSKRKRRECMVPKRSGVMKKNTVKVTRDRTERWCDSDSQAGLHTQGVPKSAGMPSGRGRGGSKGVQDFKNGLTLNHPRYTDTDSVKFMAPLCNRSITRTFAERAHVSAL